MNYWLEKLPTKLPILRETYVHENNEIKRRKALLEECRTYLVNTTAGDQPERNALIGQIDHALKVTWLPEVQHNTGNTMLDPSDDTQRIRCICEYSIGHYNVAAMDTTLDELSTSTLIPEGFFLPLVAAQNPAYKVVPVRWLRAPNPGVPPHEPLTPANSKLVDREFPQHAVQFDTKKEAAVYVAQAFHLHHPGLHPRVTLA